MQHFLIYNSVVLEANDAIVNLLVINLRAWLIETMLIRNSTVV